METLYIGLVGEKGSGKGLFAETVQKLRPNATLLSLRFSDLLRDILCLLGKEISRENFQILGNALRTAFHDDGILIGAMETRFHNVTADIIIFDGIRKKKEVALVKKRNGIVVYIHADQRVRFERRTVMSEKSDETGISWEQFIAQDNAPTETSICEIGETMADIRIENNGSVAEFETAIAEFFKKLSR